MLKQASVKDIRNGRINKKHGRIVICMRHYPRFLKRELRHEYLACLAPQEELFRDFRRVLKHTNDHAKVFKKVNYEKRFAIGEKGLSELKRLSKLSHTQDIYLVCQCATDEICHRDLLLRIAKKFFKAKID